jgi:Fe-S oxidoreductase
MKDAGDVRRFRAIAEECFALVRTYRGSHSGEHGDGIVRSEFHEAMFGARLVRAFEAVKDAFDPAGFLNPGRIVRAPRMDDRSLFRTPPDYGPDPGFTPKLDWSEHPGGLLGAAEMCSNNGTCRGFDAGAMCPSYRVTRDEQHLTRGRANTLRLALSGQLGPDAMASDALAEAMALCVSCKACRRECPTGVDMARMKLEVLAAGAERHGVPLRARLLAALPRLAPFVTRGAPVANALAGIPAVRRRLGFAPDRKLPAFRRDAFRDDEVPAGAGPKVLLLADTFNRYFEPENLRAAVHVLVKAGFRPVVARAPGGALCCGRTELAAGRLAAARHAAARVIAACAGDWPVIGLEPSCLLTLRDEFPALLPGEAARDLAARARLLPEFLEETRPPLTLARRDVTAHVHGHCHQKAHGAWPATLSMLGRVPGLSVAPITSSCCGMAGSFGYQAETADISRAMAEAALLPAIAQAAPGDLIVADGTSCRHQIADLGGRRAVHSVRVLAEALT